MKRPFFFCGLERVSDVFYCPLFLQRKHRKFRFDILAFFSGHFQYITILKKLFNTYSIAISVKAAMKADLV